MHCSKMRGQELTGQISPLLSQLQAVDSLNPYMHVRSVLHIPYTVIYNARPGIDV